MIKKNSLYEDAENSDDYKNMFKEIASTIKQYQNTVKKYVPSMRKDVERIITNKEKNIKNIEGMLDTFLEMMDFNIGEDEFLKLNKYYATINKENSSKYDEYYKERREE